MRCVFAYVNANSMACDGGGGWRRRSAGIEVEKGGDEFPAIVQRCAPDELGLKRHIGVAEQPRLTLQPADERRQVARREARAADLLHDKHLPQSDALRVRDPARVSMKYLTKATRSDASIDVCAEFGIERDGSVQQK